MFRDRVQAAQPGRTRLQARAILRTLVRQMDNDRLDRWLLEDEA
jgi:hypothetical protein